ncbi:LPS biosynthesis protein [Shouchella clausii]|uniref:oligosaccharide flippase family protein n=1 Tax=Shouchella clausii TaxID=79880 RepID=UPI001B1223F9|nr:polysaccharide biosynthesis C-terminal domain-containing protein [Shouchella clausii]GIN09775.1 LPS biosynthesis protein [Shouchella clausii]
MINTDTNQEMNVYKKTLLHYIPGVLIPAFTNIFLTLGLARILSVDLYGDYAYYLSVATLLTSIFSQWLVQSIQRFNSTEGKKPVYQLTIKLIITLFASLHILSSFVYGVVLFNSNFQDSAFSIILSVIMLFTAQSLTSIKVALYATNYKAENIKALNIKQATFKSLAVLLYLILFNDYQISHLFSVIGIVVFVNICLEISKTENVGLLFLKQLKALLKGRGFNSYSVLRYIKFLLAYGLPMTGWFIGTNLLNVGDRIVLQSFMSSADVGIYSANYVLVSTGIGLLVSPLLQTAHPIIMNYGQNNISNKAAIESFVEKLSRRYLMVSIFIVVNMFIYYEKISLLLFGAEYQSGAVIIPLTLIGIFFWNYSMYGHKGLELSKKPLTMMKFVLVCAVINLLLNLLFIPLLGIVGAGISTVIAYISYSIMVKINSKQHINWIINYKFILKYSFLIMICSYLISPMVNYILNHLIKIINGF